MGLKVTHGEHVTAGSILIRQRGTRFISGKGAKTGRDHTLYAVKEGVVEFDQKFGKKQVSVN